MFLLPFFRPFSLSPSPSLSIALSPFLALTRPWDFSDFFLLHDPRNPMRYGKGYIHTIYTECRAVPSNCASLAGVCFNFQQSVTSPSPLSLHRVVQQNGPRIVLGQHSFRQLYVLNGAVLIEPQWPGLANSKGKAQPN